MALPEEKTMVERMDPLAIPDYLFEDIIGLPGIGSVLKTIAPAEIADTLGIPTPAEVARATYERLKSRIEEKVAR